MNILKRFVFGAAAGVLLLLILISFFAAGIWVGDWLVTNYGEKGAFILGGFFFFAMLGGFANAVSPPDYPRFHKPINWPKGH